MFEKRGVSSFLKQITETIKRNNISRATMISVTPLRFKCDWNNTYKLMTQDTMFNTTW